VESSRVNWSNTIILLIVFSILGLEKTLQTSVAVLELKEKVFLYKLSYIRNFIKFFYITQYISYTFVLVLELKSITNSCLKYRSSLILVLFSNRKSCNMIYNIISLI